MNTKEVRQSVIDSLKRKLMGPMDGPEEKIPQVPSERYLTGVIFPEIIDEEVKEIDEENEKEDEGEESHSNLRLARSMGFSCVIDSNIDVGKIGINISGSKYVEESSWTNSPISSEESRLLSIEGHTLFIKFTNKKESNVINVSQIENSTLEEKNKILLKWESSPLKNFEGKHHFSLFLVNKQRSVMRKKASSSLYQCYLSLSTGKTYSLHSRPQRVYDTDEDLQSLNLLYSDRSEFGVGHSTSVNWNETYYSDTTIPLDEKERHSNLTNPNIMEGDLRRCDSIETTFFPQYNTRGLSFDLESEIYTSPISRMDNKEIKEEVIGLETTLSKYAEYLIRHSSHIDLTEDLRENGLRDFLDAWGLPAEFKEELPSELLSDIEKIKKRIEYLEQEKGNAKAPKPNLEESSLREYMLETFPSGKPVLDMYGFSDLKHFTENQTSPSKYSILQLDKVALGYKDWIEKTFPEKIPESLKEHEETIARHRKQAERCLERIYEGIDLLYYEPQAYQAFCLMNRAIWLQFTNKKESDESDGETYFYERNDDKWQRPKYKCSWRPFQLGFILQNLPSLFDKNHSDRDIVDLLWVRTGGGKTEAYLGLSAFTMFLGRLRKENLGCEVMMRYTLRLLSLQQFQRATRLIMACEIIRRVDRFEILGDCQPFTIGLYAGMSVTPNKVKGARVNAEDTAEYALRHWKTKGKLPPSSNPIQIKECPWCGFNLKHNNHEIQLSGAFTNNPGEGRAKLVAKCGNSLCDFNREPIPYQTVDETLYSEPPSMLVGTVDKFAQLAFNDHMGRLFGWTQGKRSMDPPNLLIQDELHLINGPLGSLVGLYESTIDYLSSEDVEVEINGNKPLHEILPSDILSVKTKSKAKIIASTATIRNADRQCKGLYDRSTFRFPPSGTSISDSFFVKTKEEYDKDKAYLGVLCSGVAAKTTIKSVTTDILRKVSSHKAEGIDLSSYDPFWTIVSYYNSMKELGGSVTLLRDDIRTNVQEFRESILNENAIGELHGGLSSTDLPEVLRRLQLDAEQRNPYDVVTCSNMFSVGVDVDRLGLMLMNSQPKATTEYLQATGRVGRDRDGLVAVLFNQARPRDQSHFETFYDYHSRTQIHVESMTVTPFSEGTLQRALHAQLVSFLRQSFSDYTISIRHNKEAKNFDEVVRSNPQTRNFCGFLLNRVNSISETSYNKTKEILNEFQEKWIRRSRAVKDRENPILKYKIYSPKWEHNHPRLLEGNAGSSWLDRSEVKRKYDFDYPAILTPNSLRNVEEEVDLVSLKRRRSGE